MRLLDVSTLRTTEFFGDKIPPYAILSHTWGDHEVSFVDLEERPAVGKAKAGYAKITKCCKKAAAHGFKWAWIDSCCIDKRSSAELSEAINSMFRWYKRAQICYVFLSDVPHARDFPVDEFLGSRWFARGWTLQEVIAPQTIYFYDQDWARLGSITKDTDYNSSFMYYLRIGLRFEIKSIRANPDDYQRVSVAERMSWAAHRETTREEDMAYCLMGVFNVNMPILYGEGGTRAFKRLQYEIIKVTYDHSIFCWRAPLPSSGLFANSPANFADFYNVYLRFPRAGRGAIMAPFTMTNLGLSINLRITEKDNRGDVLCELLCCQKQGDKYLKLGIFLRPMKSATDLNIIDWSNTYRRVRCNEVSAWDGRELGVETLQHIYVVEDDVWADLMSDQFVAQK